MLLALTSLAALLALGDAQACARINSDNERLRCYDLLHRTESDRRNVAQSDWVVRVDRSRLDDTTSVYLQVRSKAPHTNRFGRREHLTLHIRCVENTTALSIYFAGEFMASAGRNSVTVDYRIDERPPQQRSFRESNNNQHLGLWNGGQSIPLIREMFEASSIYIRATPFSESSVQAEFNISGLEDAIIPLREACSW